MRYGSICSGIEAATVAWKPLVFDPAWFSEIESFPCQLLKQKYPDVPNYGDMTGLRAKILSGVVEATDIVCGGTPCQAFSVAGSRESLDDHRGNLTLEFCNIVDSIDDVRVKHGKPQSIVLWENVPGVLSTKDNAFGCFLGKLSGTDIPLQTKAGRWPDAGMCIGRKRKIAWRVFDAQHFGLAQRRKRVFVVASAREDFDPSKVLFEQAGLSRDFRSCKEEEKSLATGDCDGVRASSYGLDRASFNQGKNAKFGFTVLKELQPTLTARGPGAVYDMSHADSVIRKFEGTSNTLLSRMGTGGNQVPLALTGKLRRLTPVECERLMGFPDNYTKICYNGKAEDKCPDSPRYKALGNSWAVPVVRWLGQRIKNIVCHE